MLPSWANDTITILRPTASESRGSTIFDFSSATRITINGCSVQPAGTSLNQDGRELGISDGMTAYLPPQTDVKASDRIEFNGVAYIINGDPRHWKSATGRVSSVLLNLMRWRG